MTVAEQIKAEEALSRELEPFVGKWVAVQGHRVVGSSSNVKDLLERVDETQIDGFFSVPEKASICVY